MIKLREISFTASPAAISRLNRRAETMLPPDVVMKIECAADAEPDDASREVLYALLDRVVDCGLNGRPLFRQRGLAHVFIRAVGDFTPSGIESAFPDAAIHTGRAGGGGVSLTLALFDPEYERLSDAASFSGDVSELPDYIIKSAAREKLRPLLPLFIGAGAGKSADSAMLLARRALIRPMDTENPDPGLKRLEIRAGKELNRLSSGAGAGPVAFAVHIEAEESPRHRAIVFSSPCLRRAEFRFE